MLPEPKKPGFRAVSGDVYVFFNRFWNEWASIEVVDAPGNVSKLGWNVLFFGDSREEVELKCQGFGRNSKPLSFVPENYALTHSGMVVPVLVFSS